MKWRGEFNLDEGIRFRPNGMPIGRGLDPVNSSETSLYENRSERITLTCEVLVARTRFELVISALRGRRPKPLDERALMTIEILAGTPSHVKH